MSRQTRASVNTCIVLGVSSAGSERIGFGRGGARGRRQLAAAALRCVFAEPWAVACIRALRARARCNLQRCSATGSLPSRGGFCEAKQSLQD